MLNGGNASAAYRKAYEASKMKPESINVKACELLKNGKITVRIDEIQSKVKAKLEQQFDSTVNERLFLLWGIAKACSQKEEGTQRLVNPQAAISAIDQINKMTGDHAAVKQKTEHSGSVEMTDSRALEILTENGIDASKLN